MEKPYDIILFGVTGFTGKLCAEYLLGKNNYHNIKWAASARNVTKAELILKDLVAATTTTVVDVDDGGNKEKTEGGGEGGRSVINIPPILKADLICTTR